MEDEIVRSLETWKHDVFDAIRDLGGQGHLSEIYLKVLLARNRRGEVIDGYQEWVRNELRRNSDRKGRDLFEHVGAPASGIWRLKILRPK
jgi:hypothetical protein